MTPEAVRNRGLRSRGRSVDGAVTALGSAGPFTPVVDSPAESGYGGQPATSTGISYSVQVSGQASESDLVALVNHVDVIAEIPNSLRQGTPVTLDRISVTP
jgi:hypothetical protein